MKQARYIGESGARKHRGVRLVHDQVVEDNDTTIEQLLELEDFEPVDQPVTEPVEED
jgi:hypothetical protein